MSDFTSADQQAYVCCHVFDKSRPVKLVMHDQDDDWVLTCGGYDHGETDYHLQALSPLLAADPSLSQCADLASGHEAERDGTDGAWTRRAMPE